MGDQYVCIGPYVEMKARAEIEEEDFPPHHPLGKTNFHFHCIKYNVKFHFDIMHEIALSYRYHSFQVRLSLEADKKVIKFIAADG